MEPGHIGPQDVSFQIVRTLPHLLGALLNYLGLHPFRFEL